MPTSAIALRTSFVGSRSRRVQLHPAASRRPRTFKEADAALHEVLTERLDDDEAALVVDLVRRIYKAKHRHPGHWRLMFTLPEFLKRFGPLADHEPGSTLLFVGEELVAEGALRSELPEPPRYHPIRGVLLGLDMRFRRTPGDAARRALAALHGGVQR